MEAHMYVFCEVRTLSTYNKVKLTPSQALEACRRVRCAEFHIFYTVGSQMAVRLSSLNRQSRSVP
jgi:hypothetical protein